MLVTLTDFYTHTLNTIDWSYEMFLQYAHKWCFGDLESPFMQEAVFNFPHPGDGARLCALLDNQ